MRTNRTSLFAYVAIAALGVAATSMTSAEGPAGLLCGTFGGGSAAPRHYSPAPAPREGVAAPGPPPAPVVVAAPSKPVVGAAPRKPVPAEPPKVPSTASTAAAAAEVAQA